MAQNRAAAQRKIGFTARLYYSVCGFLALLWFFGLSLEHIIDVIDDAGRRQKDLQAFFFLLAALSAAWFVLTGSKYSIIKVPRFLPKLEAFSIFALIAYFICVIDFEEVAEIGFPAIFFILIPVWVWAGLNKIHEWMGEPLSKLPRGLGHFILPILFLLSPFADLSRNLKTVGETFMAIGVPFLIFTIPVYYRLGLEYVKEHPEYRKIFIFGRGGAARWGGLYSFLKYDFNDFMRQNESKEAPIYCGGTLWYDDVKLNGRHIGLDSDSMMLTVAAMGGGKSLYAAWNTLLSWPGGAFVLDPKGEHAGRTIEVRSKIAPAHVIDPWGDVPHLYEEQCATFNPLEEIDINSPNAKDDIFQIVESCIMQEADENANSKHFRENAQKIMTGVIAHVLSEYPEKDHNLPTIYDIILTGAPEGVASDPKAFDLLVDRMAVNDAMGRAPMDAAKVLKEAGENERGGFITTLATGLSWVNTPVLRPILMKSSFKLKDIKLARETVYLVIPFEHMKNHSRFLRTVVSLGLMSCRAHAEHDFKTLYMLDEFPQLGTFRPIKEGLVTLRSRDVKIWMHLQNLGQLKERYGNWQDFMSSCDKQFFAVNDHGTAEEISDMLGEYVERWLEGKEGSTSYIDKNRPLRSPSEVMEELKKGSGLQYILPADGLPMRLKLVSFKKNFNKYGTVKGNKFG